MGKRRNKGYALPPRLSRRVASREPNSLIVVVCEGAKTEPKYFGEFALDVGNQLIRVEVVGGKGAPVSVVDEAVRQKERLQKAADQPGASSYEGRFSVWAVFDVDEHPNLKKALGTAKINSISVGLSNPCFELWPLLHFKNVDGQENRHRVQRSLKTEMPSYDHKAGALLDYKELKPKYDVAVQRAKLGLKRRNEERTPNGNPSTTVHELTELIKSEGLKRK